LTKKSQKIHENAQNLFKLVNFGLILYKLSSFCVVMKTYHKKNAHM